MPKSKSVFICKECGYESPRWYGKCPDCSSWNSLIEETITESPKGLNTFNTTKVSAKPEKLYELVAGDEARIKCGIGELDRVLGGGIVEGSLILVGGDPGIGKSTILLQMCSNLSKEKKLLYVTGEESGKQIKLRAHRLGAGEANIDIMAQTDMEVITGSILTQRPQIVIIDSIQTMYINSLSSSPGSVSQVRECTAQFQKLAKSEGITIFVVGHVNKEGSIAGPKVMEHMVDVVLYFEGEKQLAYRILRAVKNRYGSTNEIGIFEMTSSGLMEVTNPSAAFLSGRPSGVSGTCVVCILEGSRPILAEVQALVTATPFSSPRRMAVGVDYNRLCLLLAVLEKRGGLMFSNFDVYANVTGGLKLDEPSSDLGVMMSLASSLKDFIIPADTCIIGEVGLAGEVRSVFGVETRVTEAARTGFKRCIIPYQSKIYNTPEGIELIKVKSIYQAISYFQ